MVGLPETTVRKPVTECVVQLLTAATHGLQRKSPSIWRQPNLPKEGGRYDLPIALALLVASEQLNATKLNQYEFVGELALTGALRGVPGAISSAMEAIKAGRKNNCL